MLLCPRCKSDKLVRLDIFDRQKEYGCSICYKIFTEKEANKFENDLKFYKLLKLL